MRFAISQVQINRIREICQAGTQAHGDEFYEQIMTVVDELKPLVTLSEDDKRQIRNEADDRRREGR